jgi:hypothetical protein
LEDHDAVKNKFFSFYLPENEGFVTFGEVPSHIVSDEKLINWAPLIPDNENPWSVRMSDIVIQSNKRFARRRRNRSSYLELSSSKFSSKQKSQKTLKMMLRKYRGASKNPCGKEGCELLIDTGTYLTYVPREMYKHFFKDFDSNSANDCDNMDELPNIHFKVIG